MTSMRRLYLQPPLYLLLFKRDGHSFVVSTPFSGAFVGQQGFAFSLKHWCRSDDETDSDRINEEGDNLLKYIAITVLFESVL